MNHRNRVRPIRVLNPVYIERTKKWLLREEIAHKYLGLTNHFPDMPETVAWKALRIHLRETLPKSQRYLVCGALREAYIKVNSVS